MDGECYSHATWQITIGETNTVSHAIRLVLHNLEAAPEHQTIGLKTDSRRGHRDFRTWIDGTEWTERSCFFPTKNEYRLPLAIVRSHATAERPEVVIAFDETGGVQQLIGSHVYTLSILPLFDASACRIALRLPARNRLQRLLQAVHRGESVAPIGCQPVRYDEEAGILEYETGRNFPETLGVAFATGYTRVILLSLLSGVLLTLLGNLATHALAALR